MPHTVAEFRSEYTAADVFCQEVQGFRNEAGIPAINELRNAGHHLLKALDDAGAVVSQTDLDAAVAHTRRARYEASEAGNMAAVAVIHKFQKDYADIAIVDLVPDYAARCLKYEQAKTLIEAGRQHGADREHDHQIRIDTFREIRPFAAQLVAVRPEANKRRDEKQRQTRNFILSIVIPSCLALVAIAVAIIIG